MSIKDVADKHGIPQSTLRRYRDKSIDAIASFPHKSNKKAINESTVKSANPPGVSTILPSEIEQQLADWIEASAKCIDPPSVLLIRTKAQRLYYSLTNTAISDNNTEDIMSEKWWRGFKQRHPQVSTRKTTPLNIRRIQATQPEIFDHFFQLLKEQYDKYGYTREQVWALDETGVAGDVKSSKAVGPKGTNNNT